MKKWIIIALIAVAGGYWGWTKLPGLKLGSLGNADEKKVPTATATVTNVQFVISAAGEIVPAEQVSVRPEINGRIQDLPVDIGDAVKKADMLFTLEDKELQTEKASRLTEIEGARLQVDRSLRNFQRSEQLFNSKLISQELFEDTKTEYELARNSLERAQKALSIVDEKLTKTRIMAPFDCTVLTRPISVGQAVSGSGGFNSGTEVMTIANLHDMIINAHINQADVTRLKAGKEVEIEVEAVAGLKLKGIIERVAPQATIKNGIKGFAVRIQLELGESKVKPGMTANISIPLDSANNVVTVPLAAVFTEQNERYVLVKKEEQFEKRPVQIGVADFFVVEIQSGLAAGDVVALEQPPGMAPPGKEKGGNSLMASALPGGSPRKTNSVAGGTNRTAAALASPATTNAAKGK